MDEPFFVFRDRTPVRPLHFREVLRKSLTNVGLEAHLYCSHGLRTGRSVDLLEMGLSVETIKKLGRWTSNAVYQYLKN